MISIYQQNMKISTPVLFMVFNRPEKTQRVFDVIRSARPTKLYVAMDSPREQNSADIINCKKVKEIVRSVDWDCDVKYLFHQKNLGCSLAGKAAWDWFFSQEEEMIFLEDDGLVSISFFWFCQELLSRYRNDPRIAYIGGVNYGPKYGKESYFFTSLSVATYAMATWKRVYDLYEYRMESYPNYRTTHRFKKNFVSRFEYYYFRNKFDEYVARGGNTYDIQMNYLVRKYGLYCIVPNTNLTSNIGFDDEGTNTNMDPRSELALRFGNRPRFEMDEIRHPDSVRVDETFDREYFRERVLYGKSVMIYFLELYFKECFRPLYRSTVKPLLKHLRRK
jgi:hypothetical protein